MQGIQKQMQIIPNTYSIQQKQFLEGISRSICAATEFLAIHSHKITSIYNEVVYAGGTQMKIFRLWNILVGFELRDDDHIYSLYSMTYNFITIQCCTY